MGYLHEDRNLFLQNLENTELYSNLAPPFEQGIVFAVITYVAVCFRVRSISRPPTQSSCTHAGDAALPYTHIDAGRIVVSRAIAAGNFGQVY